MNGIVRLGIEDLSMKSLFLMEPEVRCPDSGTNSGLAVKCFCCPQMLRSRSKG